MKTELELYSELIKVSVEKSKIGSARHKILTNLQTLWRDVSIQGETEDDPKIREVLKRVEQRLHNILDDAFFDMKK